MRKIIYDNRDELKDLINSRISDLYKDEVERLDEGENLFQKIYARIFNAMFVKQSNYHKFDIVAEYNNAKMFVVPEEANDLPGIGFVEGMACGSAYIGLDDPMYKDIGFIQGIHYISYDGTLNDLKNKIIYYQNHNKELENIASSCFPSRGSISASPTIHVTGRCLFLFLANSIISGAISIPLSC